MIKLKKTKQQARSVNCKLTTVMEAVKNIESGQEFDIPNYLVGGNFYSVLNCAEVFLNKKLITKAKDEKTRTVYCL